MSKWQRQQLPKNFHDIPRSPYHPVSLPVIVRVANLRTQIVRCADGGLGKGTGAFQDLEIHGGIKAMESMESMESRDANRCTIHRARPWRYQSLLSSTCPVAFPAKKKHLSVTVHICALFKSVYNPPAHVNLQLPCWAFRHVPHVRSHTPIERQFVPNHGSTSTDLSHCHERVYDVYVSQLTLPVCPLQSRRDFGSSSLCARHVCHADTWAPKLLPSATSTHSCCCRVL